MTLRVGVDEAGKGPALGPMVAAAVAASPETLPEGVGDSKRLSERRRETVADRLHDIEAVTVATTTVPPTRIDDAETDMNSLTVAAHADALNAVLAEAATTDRSVEVVLDGADVDADRFARRVADRIEADIAVHAKHGADETHAVVGAASVVAKVERDRWIETIDEEYDRPVGSGYPSDPTTRTFLREYVREYGTLPGVARRSWSTCQDALSAAEQSDLREF